MPYLKGSKLTALQRATIGPSFDASLVYFVCLDGSISKRHVPRVAPLDDQDIDVLLTALRHYEASPWRHMLGPQVSSEHVAAIMQYIEELKS